MVISRQAIRDQIILVSVFTGFIASGVFTQYLPIIRYLSVMIALVFSVILILHIMNNFTLPSEIIATSCIILALIQVSLNIIRGSPSELSFFIAIILGLLLKSKNNMCVRYILVLNIVTIIIMFYEFLNFTYFIDTKNQKFEFGRLQGAFSYSKEAGYYAIAATFYLYIMKHLSNVNIICLLLIGILSGTRSAILFIVALIVVQIITQIKLRISKDRLKNFVIMMIICCLLLFFLIEYYFTDKSAYMLDRIYNTFNFASSSHSDRLFFWTAYLEGLNNYSFIELTFGAGTKLNNSIGNGAESFYLMIISQYGFTTFTLVLIVCAIIFRCLITYQEKMIFVCLLAILLVGRIGVGWADGILIWAALFSIIDQKKRFKGNAY